MKRLIMLCLVVLILPSAASAQDYIIGEGDGLTISVWEEPALSVAALVRPDGKITIPWLGDVQASGLSPMQLGENLEEELTQLVQFPIVTVTVQRVTNNKVFIYGGGLDLGVQELPGRRTLLQFLAGAGTLETVDLRSSHVLRDGEKIMEDFHALIVEGDLSQDLQLKNNDMIYLPPMRERNVYVLGAVNNPRAISYRPRLHVLEALLEAGGFTSFASENKTTIIRHHEGAESSSIPVRGKELMQGNLEENIALRPGDYIIVREGFF